MPSSTSTSAIMPRPQHQMAQPAPLGRLSQACCPVRGSLVPIPPEQPLSLRTQCPPGTQHEDSQGRAWQLKFPNKTQAAVRSQATQSRAVTLLLTPVR